MARVSRSIARSIVVASLLSTLFVLAALWFALPDRGLFWPVAAGIVLAELVAIVLILRMGRSETALRSRPLTGLPAQPVLPFHRRGEEIVGQVVVDGELWEAVLLGERSPPQQGPYVVAGVQSERLIVRRDPPRHRPTGRTLARRRS